LPAGADYVAEETGTLLLVVQFDPSGLSSEELRERRTAWERERPVLWQDVAARRGAEYQHAYLEYTERKSDAEAVVAELRERGLVGGGRPGGIGPYSPSRSVLA